MKIDNVADLIQSMAQAGVKRIFGVVGDSLNGLTDAPPAKAKVIDWIYVRHEEVAAFAAGAKRILTGELAGLMCGSVRAGQSASHQWPVRLRIAVGTFRCSPLPRTSRPPK